MDVKDFDDWSTEFNSEERKNRRKEAGLTAEDHKNLGNPCDVVVIGTASPKEAFFGFFNPEQAERMKSAGVVSKPTVTFLEN